MATDNDKGEPLVDVDTDNSVEKKAENDLDVSATTVKKINRKSKKKASHRWANIIGDEPEFVSSLLESGETISGEIVDAYAEYVSYLYDKGGTKTSRERQFMQDYMDNHGVFHASRSFTQVNASTEAKNNASVTPPFSGEESLSGAVIDTQPPPPKEIPKIKKDELVKEPPKFDGNKPTPRRWLDDFERAAYSNTWSDEQQVRYFPSYLVKAAYDWWASMAQPKLSRSSRFADVRHLFVRHWMGESDRVATRRIIDKMKQKENESVRVFMPPLVRLIRCIEPNKPEDELVEIVKEKLQPHYQEKLALYLINSLDELNCKCLQIEAGMSAAAAASKKEARRPLDSKQRGKNKSYAKPRNDLNRKGDKSDKRDVLCYRCERKGHIAPNCKCKTKKDGSPCNPKPNSNKADKTVNLVTGTELSSSDAPREESQMDKPQPVVTVRQAGSSASQIRHVCTITTLVVGGGSLLTCKVNINDIEVEAIVDTGAFISVVDHRVAQANGWVVRESKQQLMHAAGERMPCVGETLAKVEVCIGRRSKFATHSLVVVQNLCAQMLLGIELIKSLGIIIDLSADRPISFRKDAIVRGLVAKTEVKIPPRSAVIASVATDHEHGDVVTVPFGFDTSLLVANAVTRVENFEAKILLVNIDRAEIIVNQHQRLASYEPLNHSDQPSDRHINAVLQLGDTSECVTVGENLDSSQLQDLNKLFRKFIAAFSVKGELGEATLVKHQIDLIPGAKPFVEPQRRHPKLHVEEVKRQVKSMLEQGIIEPCDGPWASEYVLVKKKSGEWRLCVDYRRLNNLTKKSCYPLPNIDSCLENLAGKVYFSQLDFASGYWQVPVDKSSREYTAFRTPEGLYRFRRMPFGLTNAPASFQRLANAMFSGLKGVALQVFLDDVCIASTTWSEHLQMLGKVFEIVIQSNLKLKANKCVFGAQEVCFLGHTISSQGVKQDPRKLDAWLKLPAPKTPSEVRRVLGAFGYYRKFVPRFSILADPLIKLTKKNVDFVWGKEQEESFARLKQELGKSVTISFCNPTDPLLLKTDASRVGVAGILYQRQNNDWRMVACCSRRLTPAEANYAITDLEGLAIIHSLDKFRHFLLGRPFEIMTDHCALCKLNKGTPQSPRLKRWTLLLSEFDYRITYNNGSLHKDVDCLSRAPLEDADTYIDKIFALAAPIDKTDWLSNSQDEESKSLYEKENGDENLNLRNGVLYFRDKLFVPHAKRKEVLEETHDANVSIHDGVAGTLSRLQGFWWPDLVDDVKKYVASCATCQRRKAERNKPAGQMFPHEAWKPLQKVAADYLGPLPATLKGKKFIAVIVDTFTRFIDAKAISDQSAPKFAQFLTEYCGRFGLPEVLLTDNSKTFENATVKSVIDAFNIRHKLSTPYHSRGNAVVERAIQSIQEKLSLIIMSSPSTFDWECALPSVLLSLNTKVHKTLNYAPYELMFGRPPPIVQKSFRQTDSPQDLFLQLVRQNLEQIRPQAISNTSDAHQRSKSQFNKRQEIVEFEVGDQVLVKSKSRSAKLAPRYKGPYEVIAKDKDIYQVKDNNNVVLARHVSSMKKFINRVLLLYLVVSTGLVLSNSYLFERAAPVFWQEVPEKYVSTGTVNLAYELHLISPCAAILKFQDLFKQRLPSLGQTAQSQPISIPAQQQQLPKQQTPNGPPQVQQSQPAQSQTQPSPAQVSQAKTQLVSNQIQDQARLQTLPAIQTQLSPQVQSAPLLQPVSPLQQNSQATQLQVGQSRPPLALIPPIQPIQGGQQLNPWRQPVPVMLQPIVQSNSQVEYPYAPDAKPTPPPEEEEEGDDEEESRAKRQVKDPVVSAYQQCEEFYRVEIIELLRTLNEQSSLERRQLGGVLAGVFLSNIYSTVKEKLLGSRDTSFQDRLMLVQARLNNLNGELQLNTIVQRAHTQALQLLANNISKGINEMPQVMVVASEIISAIGEKRDLLRRLIFSYKEHRTDLVTLGELLNRTEFEDLKATDSRVIAIRSPAPNVLSVEIMGRVRDRNTKVYEVLAMNFYANITTHPVRVEYDGKRWLVKNSTSDCVAAINSEASHFVETICDIPGYRDPNLQLWHSSPVNMTAEPKHSKMLYAQPKILVYCYGNDITIQRAGAVKTITAPCPTHPFLMETNTNFSTSDGLVNHRGGVKVKSIFNRLITVFDVHDTHFGSHDQLFDEVTVALQHIKELESRHVALRVGDTEVYWRHLANWFGLALLAGTICIIIFWRKYRQSKKEDKVKLNVNPSAVHPAVIESAVSRGIAKAVAAATADAAPARRKYGHPASSGSSRGAARRHGSLSVVSYSPQRLPSISEGEC